MRYLVTGGSGFIGSALVRMLVDMGHEVANVDSMTYAANPDAVAMLDGHRAYQFHQIDITDRAAITELMMAFRPDGVFHLAAESHVDRSIAGPELFLMTNIIGTQRMMEATRAYLAAQPHPDFRFLHISTDEVFGELPMDPAVKFTEDTPYDPRSPYSASKASSDHIVRAYVNTYGFPALITNCSNNYGPYQHAEKLIPLTISRALQEQPLPVYGNGEQIRDWLYVEDHVRGLYAAMTQGKIGRSYNIGGNNEMRNIDVVRTICDHLDRDRPRANGQPHADLITFVTDRPGHDFRYAIDASRMRDELGWEPQVTFAQGIAKTVTWYIDYLGRNGH